MAESACQCEHGSHFDSSTEHRYQAVPAGHNFASMVGFICDHCAVSHLRDWLTSAPDEDLALVAEVNEHPGDAYAHDAGYFRSTLSHVLAQLELTASWVGQGSDGRVLDGLQWSMSAIRDALDAARVDYDSL